MREAQAAADAERGQGQFQLEVIREWMRNEWKVHSRCSFNIRRTELTCMERNSLGTEEWQEGESVGKVTPS